MPSMYSTIKPALNLAVQFYFRDVQVLGKESIPTTGPLILAANHPNSLLDSVILGTQTPRKIHYIARSGLFAKPLPAAIFRRLAAIPIYRPEDGDLLSEGERNEQTFAAVFELLENGGCVGIFPEGANSEPQQVRQLRTGTARMALGVEERNDFQLNLRIVPVGINFDQRDRFLTTVLIRFAKPILVSEYRAIYEVDQAEAVRRLTDDLQEAIRAQTLHIREARVGWVSEKLDEIIGERLLNDLLGKLRLERKDFRTRFFDELRATPEPKKNLEGQHMVRQLIGDVVSDVYQERPAIYRRLEQRVKLYADHAEQIRVRHEVLDEAEEKQTSARKEAVRLTVYAIAFGPLAAWGWLNNIIPWLVVRYFSMRAPDVAQKATTAFVVGFLAFPLFYALQGFALWYWGFAPLLWVILYLLTLPLAGFSWLRYRRQVFKYRERVLARLIFRSKQDLITSLSSERRRLLDFFLRLASGEAVLQPAETPQLATAGTTTSTPSVDAPPSSSENDADSDPRSDDPVSGHGAAAP